MIHAHSNFCERAKHAVVFPYSKIDGDGEGSKSDPRSGVGGKSIFKGIFPQRRWPTHYAYTLFLEC
jgi:hypothetical protein